MTFTGEFSARLNTKNQITLPSALRDQVFALESALPLIILNRSEDFLELFPSRIWAEKQKSWVQRAKEMRDPHMSRYMASISQPVALDESSHGRFVIPPKMALRFKKDTEIIFLGNFDKIELWCADAYRKLFDSDSPFAKNYQSELDQNLDFN